MKKIKLTALLLGMASVAMAQTAGTQNLELPFYQVLIGIILTLLAITLLLVIYTLQKVAQLLKREALGEKYVEVAEVVELTIWEKMLSLKPLSAEKDVELDHDFDGIKELNNPIPPWFNVLFLGTIVIGFAYFMYFHVFEAGPLQGQEYKNELALAEKQKADYVKKAGNLIDENSVTILTDGSKLKEGEQVFATKCAVCHGEKGEGKVGPNLVDEYWLHGGSVQEVFKSIKYGWPSKGMVAWQNSMNGGQMQQLTSYILSIQGTNPAGAKEPQGEKVITTPTVDSTLASSQTDSIK
ncbi:MAG: cbb3-type cytochrome c oxidase N-terminal domain-containing protein [Bacteroidota bacterium]